MSETVEALTRALTEANAVSLKLPLLHSDLDIRLWFHQIEAQFSLKGITADRTKYEYVITSLDRPALRAVADILENPPEVARYGALRSSLLKTFQKTPDEKATLLLDHHGLGDRKPSQLMLDMLDLYTDGDALLHQIFLRHLPVEVAADLARSGITSHKQLEQAADDIWSVWRTRHETPSFPSQSALTTVEAAAATHRTPKQSQLCFYHHRWGTRAQK